MLVSGSSDTISAKRLTVAASAQARLYTLAAAER